MVNIYSFYFLVSLTLLAVSVGNAYSQNTVYTEGVNFIPASQNNVKPLVGKDSANRQVQKAAFKAKREAVLGIANKRSLWAIFIAGLLGGFAAILMPCIFPMIPMTVSYFTKSSDKRGNGVTYALEYGLSIIVIYVVLGLLVTLIFGADALNSLSTNGVFNFYFF